MRELKEENTENKRNTVLRITSVRLEPNQIDFLKTLDNASEWIREAIDAKRLTEKDETKEAKTILLTKRIRNLNMELETLEQDYEFVRAKKRIVEATRIRESYASLLKESPEERFNPILNLFAEFDPFIEARKIEPGICFSRLFGTNKETVIIREEEPCYEIMLRSFKDLQQIGTRQSPKWRINKQQVAALLDTVETTIKQKRSSMEQEIETSEKELQLAKKISDAFNRKIERIQNEIEGLEQQICHLP